MRTNESKNEIDEIKKWEEKIKRKDLKYKTKQKYINDFQQFETIRLFCNNICTGKVDIDKAEINHSNLLENMVKFNDKSRPKTKKGKSKKGDIYESVNALYERRELTLNALKSGIFPTKTIQGIGLKILTLKQILQRWPIILVQVK